jgi:hypothetical protein
VVSEETGQIAIAARGDIEPDVTLERVRERLARHWSGRRKHETLHEPRWQVEP